MSDKGIILVTGANRGIGAAIANTLLKSGYSVGCLSRSGALPQGLGGPDERRSIPIRCDVTDPESLKRAFKETSEAGAIVGLVNNAGIHRHGKSQSFSLEDYELVMRTNATATFVGCQEVYPYLVEAGGGLIVNIGSLSDKLGSKYSAAYCASKAAVGAITRSLAVEWARQNIQVLDVAPGYILTDLTSSAIETGPLGAHLSRRIPARKPGSAEEVGKLVTALFTSAIPYLSGTTIYIDGGHGIAD